MMLKEILTKSEYLVQNYKKETEPLKITLTSFNQKKHVETCKKNRLKRKKLKK